MADDIDIANDLAEMEREAAIYCATRKPIFPYVARCYNCDEPIESGAFCDPDCSEDYRMRRRFKA